jgi:hypothetical protein
MPCLARGYINNIMDDHPYRQARGYPCQQVLHVSARCCRATGYHRADEAAFVDSAPGSGFLHSKKDYAVVMFDLDAGML